MMIPRVERRRASCTELSRDTAAPELEMLEFRGEWEDGTGQALDPALLEQARLDATTLPTATTGAAR